MAKKNLLSILFFIFFTISKIFAREYLNSEGDIYSNPLIDSVRFRFEQIPGFAVSLWVWPDNNLKLKLNEAIVHESIIKSIIRLPRHIGLGGYMALTTIDNKQKINLFILDMRTEKADGLYLHNLIFTGEPKEPGCAVVKQIVLSKKNYLNVGTMQICGRYLAIPLIKKSGIKIKFYDIGNPTTPIQLKHSINMPPVPEKRIMENYSVALTRLNSGNYLIAIWASPCGLYLYLSDDIYLEHSHFKFIGFFENNFFHKNDFAFSSINFVQDVKKNVYLIGAHTKDFVGNFADLFLLNLDTKKIIWLSEKKFALNETSCFNTGCSVYIHDSENLWLYSCNPRLTIPQPDLYPKNDQEFVSLNQYGRINN
jgi:hypothetical protein